MLINQKVAIKWHNFTKKHYISLGYKFTDVGEIFEVDIKHLPQGSHSLVKFICDYCNGENQIKEKHKWKRYSSLIDYRKKSGKDCCFRCARKRSGVTQSTSAANMPNSLILKSPHLIDEWDYEKNKKSPNDYSYGSTMLVWWKCKQGHEWTMRINARTEQNQNCPYCSGKRINEENSLATKHPYLVEEWHPLKNSNTPYEVSAGMNKKVWWKCSKCSFEWEASPNSRTHMKSGCPKCVSSRGESAVREHLEAYRINYVREYSFHDLRGIGGGLLRFDFAIFDKCGSLKMLIEYDGEFHFEKCFEGDQHEMIVAHDKIKNEYCLLNKIPLLRIPYWEFNNINQLLENELLNHGLIQEDKI